MSRISETQSKLVSYHRLVLHYILYEGTDNTFHSSRNHRDSPNILR